MKAPAKKAPEPKSLLVIHDAPQGSEEWRLARLGLVTASNFSVVMANGKDGGPSLTRMQYLHRLAGEIITGRVAEETFKSKAMERGNEVEPLAIEDYERRKGVQVRRVGLAVNFSGLKRCGASADGLVGFDGAVEIKSMRADLMIPLLLKGSGMPPEHRAQVMGSLLVLERDWIDFKIYCEMMPDFTVRIFRDEVYLRELHNQIQIFNHDLGQLVAKLKAMGATG